MNPTEQSGNDMCEQPTLSWVDYRNLAGLSIVALAIFFLGSLTLSSNPEQTPASANEAIAPTDESQVMNSNPPLDFIDVSDPIPEELPHALIESVN